MLASALKMSLLTLAIGCTLGRTVASARLDAADIDAGFDAGSQAELEQRWGQYVATLPIPPCLDGGVLTVDSDGDELEGGISLNSRANAGATLSFREALFIAANTPGPHRIFFDQATFAPGSAPPISITDAGVPFPPLLAQTCIDARDRAVVVDFRLRVSDSKCAQPCMFSLGAGSQLTGLVIKGDPQPMYVTDALVAGNRLSVAYVALRVSNGALVGPANVFGSGQFAIETQAYHEGQVHGARPSTGSEGRFK